MFCVQCGKEARSAASFCSGCGAALSQGPQARQKRVDVTVNVGGPSVVAPQPAQRSGAFLTGVTDLVQAMRQAALEREQTLASLRDLRAKLRSELETCYDLVTEIEGARVLATAPPGSPHQRTYMRALDRQSDVARVLEGNASLQELRQALITATEAASALDGILQQAGFSSRLT